jgi:hypothetical protein
MDTMKNVLGQLSGGSTDQTPAIDPNSGAQTMQSTPKSATEMVRGMFSGMLTGLSGGVKANAAGSHGALGAFAGGFDAQQGAQAQQKQQKQVQAQQTFENQQKTQKQQAELAYMRQQQATSMAEQKHLEGESANLQQAGEFEKFDHAQRVITASQQADARASILATFPDVPGTQGFKTRGDAEQYAYAHPELTKRSDLQIVTDPDTNLTHIKVLPQTGPTTHEFKLPDGSTYEGVMTSVEAAHFKLELAKQTIEQENADREKRVSNATISHLAAETKSINETAQMTLEDHKSNGEWKPGEREKLSNTVIRNLADISTRLSKAKLMGEATEDPENYNDLKEQYASATQLLSSLRQPKPAVAGAQGTVQPTASPMAQSVISQHDALLKSGKTIDQLKKLANSTNMPAADRKAILDDLDKRAQRTVPQQPAAQQPAAQTADQIKFANR